MDVVIIVASVNRAAEIGQLLRHLENQTKKPSEVILSVASDDDLPADLRCMRDGETILWPGVGSVRVIRGCKGLTGQRNRALDVALKRSDAVVFFDDDFLPANDAIQGIADLFETRRDVVGATGYVLRDGVKLGGLSYEDAIIALDKFQAKPSNVPISMLDTDEVYGCNMAFRASAVGGIRFDERLPLYAWQEDVDFAGQLRAKGRIVKTTAFCGVHRGVNKGRSPGLALGFSQMVNPIYLARKGTMRPTKAAVLMFKNFLANHAKCLWPESYVDRFGRMRGNWRGLFHLVRGYADPMAILHFGAGPATLDGSQFPHKSHPSLGTHDRL
jgi:GT2 family glycosyltransferase